MKTLGSNNSPVDTLAINYIRFLVNNLLTWVAAVKAALSVWTIRSELPLPPPSALPQPQEEDNKESSKESTPDEQPVEGGVKLDARAATLTLPPAATVCVTKGRRFTMCFFEDDCCREDDEAALKEEEAGAMEVDDGGCVSSGDGEWWCAWEKVLRETSGEAGWYRCQDLSLLDGCVVRLWDDRR